ncbi:2-isopropylmalate synthase [Poriferisphaera corsica]|uniref:Citramalate synthase n=1 Tax=Poriferisphaera corsica TaxID=2528020 RepID=A0A517YTX2_9BACT|nr:citramalate synthase [Poriferisphaera corsica]QDU33649.1 2-isopropylmalate synthase [Poriferisphaera corsica]
MSTEQPRRIEIYDTTLRDGTQGEGVTLSLVDKLKITQKLDELGFDYIEGGYPLSNPKDVAYFEQVRDLDLKHAKVCAFGMTRRKGIKAKDDVGMNALVDSKSPVITIVGKTWDLHVDEVLGISREENLAMIEDSIAFCTGHDHVEQVFYDAEHFFDGFKANPEYAIQTLKAALAGGATRLVLCDTNGGSMPEFVLTTIKRLKETLPEANIAIHTHNDCGLAVANSLVAVRAGAVQVQGTINGIGERCGNVDLITVVANLKLKLGFEALEREDSNLHLTELSRYVYELANQNLVPGQPYVGSGAFAHKGGMHVHAVQRIAHSYEHVTPESVGNSRRILVSELSGASNIAATLGKKFDIENNRDLQREVLDRVQVLENKGYQFEAAEASFELLLYKAMNQCPDFWHLDHYRCVILKNNGNASSTEAIVKVKVGDDYEHTVAEGDGPVNALDGALRKALQHAYPQLHDVKLMDYKVRVVNPNEGTAAKVRVMIEFAVRDENQETLRHFTTVGVNENIVDASWEALTDAFAYHLIEAKAETLCV